jgi:tetratricopeptide (TPR) repeat protein
VTARTALDAARPILARMDISRGPENTKADLIAVWSAVEAALHSLVGNTSASGQALIREARARQSLTFDQANGLVALLAVREQLDRPDYQPTDSDVNTARAGFLKLDAGLMEAGNALPTYGTPAPPSPYAPGSTAKPAPPPPAAITPPAPGLEPMMRKRRKPWVVPVVITAVVLLVVGIPLFFLFGRNGGGDQLAQGTQAYQRGDRVSAASAFEQAARANPNDAMPHVYLARMAREVGNYTVANQELQLALKAEPGNLTARREYGAFFLSQGNYDMARTWYVHALEINPNDLTSQGWLGCALTKLGRADQAMTWLSRAGNGPWSACVTAAVTAPPTIRP